MLSLSSASSASGVVSRPVLMTDAALRPAAVARAIAPTTAISKERSRVEARVPEGIASPAAQAPAPAVQAAVSSSLGARGAWRSWGGGTSAAPQAEPTPVQKAVDVQIKELFGAVWKASGKAVDFLLGRPEPTPVQVAAAQEPMSAIIWSLTAPPGSRFSQAALAEENQAVPTPADQPAVTYSPKRASLPVVTSGRGQLLDVQA